MHKSYFRIVAVLVIIFAAWQVTPARMAQLSQSSVVSSEVESALQENDTVKVIINLNTPEMSAMSMDDKIAAIQSLQAFVLSGLSENNFTLKRRFQVIPSLAGEINATALKTLSQNSNVASIELDRLITAHDTTALSALQADKVHANYGVTGKGVTVAVLDTGIDLDNDDFEDRILAQHCFTYDNCQEKKGENPELDESDYAFDISLQGHGTHVAGIIASSGAEGSETKGFAPEANLMVVRVLDEDGESTTSDITAGLQWVYTNTILGIVPVDVINMSLGTNKTYLGNCDSEFTSIRDMINLLNASGVAVFASTGNNGKTNSISAPACLSHVTAVGATADSSMGRKDWYGCSDDSPGLNEITCFTNRSTMMDLVAPGAKITSSAVGGGENTLYGTSQASPVAAGVAALMLQVNPDLTPEEIEAAMQTTGVAINDSESGLTFYRLDALNAVQSQSSAIIAGSTVGLVGNIYTFQAVVHPFSISLPITYTWEVDGYAKYVSTTPSINTAAYIFYNAETKTIHLTVTNNAGTFTDTHTIKIFTSLPNKSYLPVMIQQ